jgi:hypothetical protein
MQVYNDYRGNHKVMIQPGVHDATVSEWMSSEGKPLLLEVQFINGLAEVSDPVGKYMVDKGLARATRIDAGKINFPLKNQKGNIICPDCRTEQKYPTEKTNYLCSNFHCRRDFVRNPV